MNEKQWNFFCSFRQDFKQKVKEWSSRIPDLGVLQKKAAEKAATPAYSFETPVVYNTDLEKITRDDEIKLIVIGDNPGKDEQLAKNQRYLCGQAGKIADGFFRRNPELGIDFRKNVIILNKTPVHSAKTAQLQTMMKDGGSPVCDLIMESQKWMAQNTARLLMELDSTELWLVGYSALREKGFFVPYREELKSVLKDDPAAWNRVYVFQHFSMNRFTIDLDDFVKKNDLSGLGLMEQIHKTGEFHKQEIF
ncbi:MAG: hypothetical protein IK102_09235 [Treponema sp.]|nr:hypothetical protein [Treponema sp.]